jgi:hypothetical protein
LHASFCAQFLVMFSTYNFTTASLNHPDHPIFHSHPLYYSDSRTLIPLFSDPLLAILAPLPTYWLISLLFHLFDISNWKWLEKYRIQGSVEIARGLRSAQDNGRERDCSCGTCPTQYPAVRGELITHGFFFLFRSDIEGNCGCIFHYCLHYRAYS